jgi:hypothetical protein
MSTLTISPTDPKELRPLLHAEVDRLRDEHLLVLHRVALDLELEEVTERLNTGFDADRAAGKLVRLPELIRAARASIHANRKP